MSRIDEINTILDSLGAGATYDEVEYALRDYGQRELISVLADRSLSAAGGAALTVTGDTGEVENVATLNLAGATVAETAPGEAEATVSVPVLSVTVELTDAQIKALPTTPVSVLAAPDADQVIVLVGGMMRLNRSGGDYGNNAASSLQLFQSASLFEASCKVVWSSLRFANRFAQILPALTELDSNTVPEVVALQLGEGLVVASDNSLGNYDGGNAANYLRITVLYMLLDV